MPLTSSFSTKINRAIAKLKDLEPQPDKANTAPLLQDAFLWDTVASQAKHKSDQAWDRIEKEGLYNREALEIGESVPVESETLALKAKVTNPVRRLDEAELIKLMGRHKISHLKAKEIIEAAKIPGKSRVILSIVERS